MVHQILADTFRQYAVRSTDGGAARAWRNAVIAHGDATFGFATESLADHPALVMHAIETWRHFAVVRVGHSRTVAPTTD